MNDCLKEFKCAVSKDGHFIKAPIALACGHSVCHSCLYEEANEMIKCKRCDVAIDRSILNNKENGCIKTAIELNIKLLLTSVERELNESLDLLKGFLTYILIIII